MFYVLRFNVFFSREKPDALLWVDFCVGTLLTQLWHKSLRRLCCPPYLCKSNCGVSCLRKVYMHSAQNIFDFSMFFGKFLFHIFLVKTFKISYTWWLYKCLRTYQKNHNDMKMTMSIWYNFLYIRLYSKIQQKIVCLIVPTSTALANQRLLFCQIIFDDKLKNLILIIPTLQHFYLQQISG